LKCPFSLPESSFEIEFLYNDKEAKVEVVEHTEPYEVGDKVVTNKHGIVFKEFIYVSKIKKSENFTFFIIFHIFYKFFYIFSIFYNFLPFFHNFSFFHIFF
jgi:hypothetical protein